MRTANASRNASPSKKDVMAQARALGIVWDVFSPYDWAAVSVALDALAEGDEREADDILAALRATNGHFLSQGLRLDHGYLRYNELGDDPDLDPEKPHWVLQERYYGVRIPRRRRPERGGMPHKIVPLYRKPGEAEEWFIESFRGNGSLVYFPSAQAALAFAETVEAIDDDGIIHLKKGVPEGDLRAAERDKLQRDAQNLGYPADYRRGAQRALARLDAMMAERGVTQNPARPSRAQGGRRVKVYEAAGVAKAMRESFANRAVERIERLSFGWPVVMQAIGESLAVAYGSDKWKHKDHRGRREVELYKHLAESKNRILARPGVIRDKDDPARPWPVIGPKVRITDVPMPSDFAVLGLFEGIDLRLHTGGSATDPRYGRGDDGIIHVRVGHGYLGGSKIRWSEIEPGRADEPFIFVYTKDGGVMFLVIGDELDIEKDGIVG